MTPFLEFVRDRVTPTLREVGCTGRGRTYRFLRDGGHVAVFWLHQRRSGGLAFFVDQALVVREWVEFSDWYRTREGEPLDRPPFEKSSTTDGPLDRRLRDQARPKKTMNDLWKFDGPDPASVDRFVDLLRRDAVEMAELTDPAVFEEQVRAGSLRQRWTFPPPDPVLLIISLLGQNRFDEARERLPETEGWRSYDDLAAYMAERAKEARPVAGGPLACH